MVFPPLSDSASTLQCAQFSPSMKKSISEHLHHDIQTPPIAYATRMTTEEGWDRMKWVHRINTPVTIGASYEGLLQWMRLRHRDSHLISFLSLTAHLPERIGYLSLPGEVESSPTRTKTGMLYDDSNNDRKATNPFPSPSTICYPVIPLQWEKCRHEWDVKTGCVFDRTDGDSQVKRDMRWRMQ